MTWVPKKPESDPLGIGATNALRAIASRHRRALATSGSLVLVRFGESLLHLRHLRPAQRGLGPRGGRSRTSATSSGLGVGSPAAGT
jgi:hypothetical protein